MTEKTIKRAEIIRKLRSLVNNENPFGDNDKEWIMNLLGSFYEETGDKILKCKINESPEFKKNIYQKLEMIILDLKTITDGDILVINLEGFDNIIKFKEFSGYDGKIIRTHELYNELGKLTVNNIDIELFENEKYYLRKPLECEKILLGLPIQKKINNNGIISGGDLFSEDVKNFCKELEELNNGLGNSIIEKVNNEYFEVAGKQEIEILKLLGNNEEICRVIEMEEKDEMGDYGIYTYLGRVYVKFMSSNIPFWTFSRKQKNEILELLLLNKFEIIHDF